MRLLKGAHNPKLGRLLFTLLTCTLSTTPAFAAGSGDSGLSDIVFIVVFLGVAYVLTQVVVNYLKKRKIILSGVEYIVIGLGLKGASYLGGETIITHERLLKMAPVLTLVIGVLGLVLGLQANDTRQPAVDRDALMGSSVMGFLPAMLVFGGFLAWYHYLGRGMSGTGNFEPYLAAGLVLSVTALLSDSEVVKNVIAHEATRKGRVSRYLYNATWLSEIFGVLLFGTVLCVLHEERAVSFPDYDLEFVLNASDWLIFNLILGALLGLIFVLFLRSEQDDDRLFLAGIGILVFACGLAFYLSFSSLFINFFIGFFLGRFTKAGKRLLTKLYPFIEPCYVIILIFAGLYFELPPWQGWVLAVGYLGLRIAGKLIGGRVFYENTQNQQCFRNSTSLGMLAPGALTIAMSIKYEQLFDDGGLASSALVSSTMTSILLTFIVLQFMGPRLIHNVLVDAAEISEDEDTGVLDDMVFEADLLWSDDELDETPPAEEA